MFVVFSGIFLFFSSCVLRVLFTIENPPSVYPPLLLGACILLLILGVAQYYHSRCVFDFPHRVRYKDITRILKSTKLIWLYKYRNRIIHRKFKKSDSSEESFVVHTWPNFLSAANCKAEWEGNEIHDMDICEFLYELRKIRVRPLFLSLYSYPQSDPKFIFDAVSLLNDKAKLCELFGHDVYMIYLVTIQMDQITLN